VHFEQNIFKFNMEESVFIVLILLYCFLGTYILFVFSHFKKI